MQARWVLLVLAACGGGDAAPHDAIADASTDGPDDVSLTCATLSPQTHDYGAISVGQSTQATFSVSNPCANTLAHETPTLTGTDANQFTLVSTACPVLPTSHVCTLVVAFAPTSTGAKHATLMISGDVALSAELDGFAMVQDTLVATTPLVDFGTGTPTSAISKTVTFENAGTGALPPISLAFDGSDASAWSLGTDGCTGVGLAAGATCDVVVLYKPQSVGAKAAQLTATAGAQSAKVTLAGSCCGAGGLTVVPTIATFDVVHVGAVSAVQTITVTNSGGAPTSAPSVGIGGADAGQFAIASSTCTAAIGPGGTCTVAVTFAPTSAGDKAATLTVVATPGGTATSTLLGTGSAEHGLAIAPVTHDFGAVHVGVQSGTFHFTASNTGIVTTAVPTVVSGGANATQFALATTCTAALAPGATCGLDVKFAPNIDSNNDTATVTISAGGDSAVAMVFGQAVSGPGLIVSSNSVDFGTLAVGTTAQQMLTVTNPSTFSTGVPSVTKSGPAATDYTVVGNTCTAALAPNEQCAITISSTPSATGLRSASLLITATPGGTASVALHTEGI